MTIKGNEVSLTGKQHTTTAQDENVGEVTFVLTTEAEISSLIREAGLYSKQTGAQLIPLV